MYEISRNFQKMSSEAMLPEGAWFYDRSFLPPQGVLLSASPVPRVLFSFTFSFISWGDFFCMLQTLFGGFPWAFHWGLLNFFFSHLTFTLFIRFFTIRWWQLFQTYHLQLLLITVWFRYCINLCSLFYSINLLFLLSALCSSFSTISEQL